MEKKPNVSYWYDRRALYVAKIKLCRAVDESFKITKLLNWLNNKLNSEMLKNVKKC